MNEFEWMNDVPGGDFDESTMEHFFEYAQVGDEVYMHGSPSKSAFSTVKYDTFGIIVFKKSNKVQIQVPEIVGGSDVRLVVPAMYEKVPELWVQDKGFHGKFEVVEEIDRTNEWYGAKPTRRKVVVFRNVVTIIRPSRFMPEDWYNDFKIHLIDRVM
jgi:hypothetical protein